MSPSSTRSGLARAFRVRLSVGFALLLSFFAALALPSASLAADTDAPQLVSSTVSPGFVNITGAPQTVTVTFRVKDATGVVIPAVTATSDLRPNDSTGLGQVSLVSGTAQDGTYQAVLTVGRGSVGGGWTARALTLTDQAGNTAANVVLGHFTVFAFGFDTTPPQLVDSSISPTAVDVTNGPATVTATLHVTDDYSGTKSPVVTASSSDFLQSTNLGDVTLVSGDKHDGIYSIVVTIPAHAAAGPWTLRLLPLSDESGNNSGVITSLGVVTVTSDKPAPAPAGGTTTTTSVVNTTTTTTTTNPAGGASAVLGTKATSKSYLTLVSTSGKGGLKVTKAGKLQLKLHCTGVAACRGSLRVYLTVKGKKYKVVSRRVSVKAGATTKATFTLTKAGKKVVKQGKKAKTSVSIWTDGIAAPRTTSLTVKRALR
ncbi:MAG: hypothetical protein AAGC46_18355 [Solirubrobacteraceae bacterium]